jgi:uncharacterized membrane protein
MPLSVHNRPIARSVSAIMSVHFLKRPAALFVALWLFLIFVSVFDGYLGVRFRHELHQTELNPVGRLLINLNGGQVWLLLVAKFVGTVTAATIVLLIYGSRPQLGLTIAGVLAALQLALLLFLLLS